MKRRGRGAKGRAAEKTSTRKVVKEDEKEPESASDSVNDSSYEAESSDSLDDSDRDEHWVPNAKSGRKRGRPWKDTIALKSRRFKLETVKTVEKKEEKKLSTGSTAEKKDGQKTITIGKMTFPEQLPLKKPSEREWEAVGMDMYGHMVPDPDCKWGFNFVVPHDLDKIFCDICQLECASRTGLVNHRKTHFRTLKRFDEKNKPPEAKAKCSASSTVTTATVKPVVSQSYIPAQPRKRYNAQGTQTEISGSFYTENEKLKDKEEESTSETIYRLVERGDLKQCVCGLLFTDTTLFFLHKGVHHDQDPKKCSLCNEKFNNYYDFSTHFYDHQH